MKISVCIPMYNAEACIETCARSLLAQEGVDLECLFVDDGSQDGTVSVLTRLARELDPSGRKAKIIKLPHNQGRVAARFAALAAVTGDYVGFCDADDWVEPDCYRRLAEAAGLADADAAICAYVDVASDGTKSAPRRVTMYATVPAHFVARSFYSPGFNSLCNKIFRTSLAKLWLQDTMPDLSVGEDLLLTMRFYARARRLVFVDDALYNYRKTDASVSRAFTRRTIGDMAACLRLLVREFPQVPKAALDVMRVHALWAAFRSELSNAELKALAAEYAIDYAHVTNVPVLKRCLLPLCTRVIPAGRVMIRTIECLRRLAS